MTKPYRHWARAGSFAGMPRDEVQRRIRTKETATRRTGHGYMLVPTVVHYGLSPEHMEALERLAAEGAYIVTYEQWTQGGQYRGRGPKQRGLLPQLTQRAGP
jgi:hypothetical protein